jgi:hypothetical protein
MRKKKIIFYTIAIFWLILLIIFGFLSIKELAKKHLAYKCMQNAYNFESSSPFSINKIVYFSGANCTSNINNNSSFTISDLYQYTDIAIFINNGSDNGYTAENTLKGVEISDVSYYLAPSVGTPSLYYKNINDFTNNNYDENNLIESNLNFNISSEDEIDYSTPTLFNNCANPITICYVNSDLKDDYTLTDNISNISYNGSLLKSCNITLNSIACKLSFVISITNNLDEVYRCPLILTIPLSTESSTIYDGNLILEDAVNYSFLKTL